MRNKMSKLLSVLLTLVLLLSLAGPLAPSARAEGPYKVSLDDSFHGSVTADKDMADEGETVRLTVTPSAGYIIESISVYAIKLHTTVPTTYSEGNYVFTMPASEVQASATFRPAAPSTTEIPSVGLALTLPAAGGSYGGSATASITSGTGFTLTGAKWFNGGTPETNPGCGLAPSSFEAGKPYFAEIYLTAEDGYGFTESTAVTLTGGATVKSTARDHGITTLTIVTNDYTIPAAAATTYTITVTGGKAYKAGGVEITSAAEGDSVYILFDDDAAPAGKYIEWGSAVTEPAVSISAGMISGTEYQAGFIMPAANITVSPDYLDQKSLTVDLTGGTSTDTSAASNAVWSLYRAEDLGLITADISDSHQEKFDLDKDGSWDVTYSTNDSKFSVQDSCSVTGDKTLTIPAAEYSPITFLFKAAAVPYTVDLSTGKMDLATGQEFADLFNSLGAWTHMSSTSGSSTYYYDLDKDGTEDISVTNSSSSRNVLLLTTSNITTDTYVISDSTGPYNPITFILKAPTVTTYTVTLIAYDKTNGTEQAGGEVAFSDSGKGTRISGDYEGNSSRTVGVYPASDYTFTGWAKGSPSGEIVSTSSPYTFTVTEDVTLYALFEKITTYPVWVGGVHVTSANKDDILSDGGKAKYDPDSKTLTVDNPTISGPTTQTGVIYAEIDELTITGKATLNLGNAVPNGIEVAGNLIISGAGTDITATGGGNGILAKNITISGGTVNATGCNFGVYADSVFGGNVTISGGSVTAKATGSDSVRYGINGNTVSITGGTVTATSTQYAIGGTDISISGGTVTATGDRYGISQSHEFSITGGTLEATGIEVRAFDFSSITVGEGLDVLVNTEASASGATAWNGTDPLGGQNTVIFKYVKIEPGAEKYPVWVGGEQVTSTNKDDILGDGKASFDPDTNTLTLNSPTVSTSYKGALIYAEGIDLNITGKATLKNEDTAYGVLVKDGSLNSDANLTVEVRQYGVSATKSININGGSVNSKTTGHGSDGVGYALGGSDIKISSGTVTATSAQGPAISTTNSVEISGGTVNVTGGFHGISTKSLAISGGTVTVEGNWNGIKAEENITISGGTVAAKSNKSSYKGIYAGGTIEIKNGTACVTADGNSGAIEGSKITIGDALIIQEPTGGKLSGDGKVIQNADGTVATHAVIVPGEAVTTYPVWVGGVQVTSANKDDILGDGKASFDPDSNTLTLDNPTVSGAYHNAAVYAEVDLTITGSATLSKTILVNAKDLTLDANIVIATPGWDSAIVAGNITVNGGSIIASADEDALLAGSSITINDGSVVGNECDLYAGSITIAGGTVNVSDGLFGIYSKNDITISGGTVTAKGNDYGIYAGGSVTISGGSVTATGSECGISAAHGDVTISGGTVTAKSDTVGIEATNGTIKIQNGTTSVTADGAGAAIGAGGITIGDEMMIKEPAGGFIGDITGSRVIKNPDDTTATHTVIVPKEAATHTVTFEANGGTPVPEAQTVADGGKATKPADPTKPGVSFGGWYKDEFFTEVFDFNTPITGNITLYAKWIQYVYILEVVKVWEDDDDAAGKRPDSVDVKVLGNGTEVSTVTLTKDEEWKKVFLCASGEADLELTCEEIVPEGYTLKDMSRTGNTVTLTNQYIGTSPVPTTYTVTFETNGGSAVASQTVNSGEKATKPADPTKSGFVFDGWYADATFAAAFDFDAAITADVTVYAKWTEESKPGEIVYTIVSGGNSTWTKGSSSGVTIVVKRDPNDEECFSHFASVQIDGTALVNGTDFSAVAGSTVITLNASALQKLTTGTKTVTINFDDGKATTSLIIKAGSSGTSGGTSPRTGDNSNPGLWITVMVLSGLGLGGLVVNDKKRRYLSRH